MADDLAVLASFLGEWDGHETGKAGEGVGHRRYDRVVSGRYIELRGTSTYEPQELNPEGEVHEEVAIFSHDEDRSTIVLREFHSEGFVITYTLTDQSSGDLVFVSEDVENGPAGLRARLTLHLEDDDHFSELFELSQGGGPFERFISNRWTRR
jgi:hypothetical protein